MSISPTSYTTWPTANLDGLDTGISPLYTFLANFSLRRTDDLIDSAQLKGHLALLHAFAKLRSRINGLDEHDKVVLPLMPDDKERRWTWFVGLAVERFEKWVLFMEFYDTYGKPLEDVLPPLDVTMVWHAYMLNPGWYGEDCDRLPSLEVLKEVGRTLATSLHRLPTILDSGPSVARIKAWTLRTSRAFDPIEDAAKQVLKPLMCPLCRNPIQAPLMTSEGQGYLQQNFSIRCPNFDCSDTPMITKNILGARKLAEDLVRSGPTVHSYLAGTLRTPALDLNIGRAKRLKDIIMQARRFARPKKSSNDEEWVTYILKQNKFTLENIRTTMAGKMRAASGRLISRIFSAYTDDKIFSVELVGAVLRQGSFVKKMHELQWTEPGFFENAEDEIALQHAIGRYYAFLDLMSSSPASFFVPTLDIDLAWHTHQLMANKYKADCGFYVGRFVDHDDKVEENYLASAFDITCRAWKNRFGVQYTHCGCPLPGETIGQKLSRLVGIYTSGPSYPTPPERGNFLAATHPSDHNAVFAYHRKRASEASQNQRRKKLDKRRKRDEQLAKQGKFDQKKVDRAQGHEAAFLVPVPIYYTYGPMIAGCAAGTGSVVDNTAGGSGMCAAGAGNCGAAGGASGGCGGGGGGGGGGCGGGSGGGGGCGGGGGGGGGDGGGGGGCGGGGGGGDGGS